MAEANKKTLDKVLAEVNKKYGKGTVLRSSEALSLVVDRIPIGIFELDVKIGGGFPRGRIINISGEFSTGKSGLAFLMAAAAQRRCRFCNDELEVVTLDGEVLSKKCKCGRCEPNRVVWADAEHSYDPSWARQWGVDTSNVYVIQTEYAEQCIDVGDHIIRSGECDMMIIDSVAALTPSVEIEESSEKWQMGVAARLMSKALRKWTSGMNSRGLLAEKKCTVVLINQLRLAFGGYHPVPTEPGGKSPAFYASLMLRLKRDSIVEEPGTKRPIGVNIEFTIKKNKTAPSAEPGHFKMYFVNRPGIPVGSTDNATQVVRAASYWQLLEKAGSWVKFPDGSKVQGMDNAGDHLEKNPELMELLMDEIREREFAWKDGVADEEDHDDGIDEETEAEDVE